MEAVPALYDTIGVGYSRFRRPDPRLFDRIATALGEARSVLNVGAGAGSYEPADRAVVAVEPSSRMISQRPATAATAVVGVAERLPVADGAVDAAMAVMSLQHWQDLDAGIDELRRASRGPIVLVTMDVDVLARHWIVTDYAPDVLAAHARFPSISHLRRVLPAAEVLRWSVPSDCTDWFMAALWGRPELYLRPAVRAATSVWHQLPPGAVDAAMARLSDDLASGRWDERHGQLRTAPSLDVGVRIVRGRSPARW